MFASRLSREVVAVRVPNFLASVEQHDNAELCGRPIAVGLGVVSSCSAEARTAGVRPTQTAAEARQRCPELLVVPERYARYEQVARHLRTLCHDFTALVEPVGLDQLYLDFGTVRPNQRADLRTELVARVRAELGLEVVVGAGTSKLVAQLAAQSAGLGEVRAVEAGAEKKFLAPHSVRVLPAADGAVAQRLERCNVRRVGELAGMPEDLLMSLFRAAGKKLYQQARGIDLRPVVQSAYPDRIQRWLSFASPVADRAHLAALLDYLLDQAACWMRSLDLSTRGVLVTVQYNDGQTGTAQAKFTEATQRDVRLRVAAQERLTQAYRRRLPLRLLALTLAPLHQADHQASLFTEPNDERADRLQACKDAIQHRFGTEALRRGHALLLEPNN